MELQAAREIIETLAQGIHPVTGQAMPEDRPYNAPPVIRALFAVSKALDTLAGAASGQPARPARPRREPPPNTGKPWSAQDDEQLRAGFDAGTPTKDLAAALGRTRWAIESRLVKLGVMTLGAAPAALATH
ncbi:hypothetical protein PE066_15960 [Ramlibacter tataouinensis]|uniref:hypothetical protein n=1 Tax=Ramlibacter tataouinensis TaxID=94132 RepID=UPI0022F38E48|nr:hypothetical protein [Ramlibacter tataouinensis]WBY00946.1 hypothetical protein PE066_15960 [Ramlibacter tataouinensis]